MSDTPAPAADPFDRRSWTGPMAVLQPFKEALEAAHGQDVMNIVGPDRGEPPKITSKNGLFATFYVCILAGTPIAVPEGAIEAEEWLSTAILPGLLASAPADQPAPPKTPEQPQ